MTAKQKAIALLSGGLDSTVALAWAVRECELVRVVFFDYGQRAAMREAQAARALAGHFEAQLEEVNLPFFSTICGHVPVMEGGEAPGADKWPSRALGEIKQLWVPNRNAVFVCIGAAFAEGLGCEVVVAGFNAEEAEQFPDNSVEFVGRANSLLAISTLSKVRLVCPLIDLNKEDILRMGVELEAPLELVYSCYLGKEMMCGDCISCVRLGNAVARLPSSEPRYVEAAAKINRRFRR